MKKISKLQKSMLMIVVVILMSIGLVPWVLYEYALTGVEGYPQLPTRLATTTERAQIWQEVHGVGEPLVTPITPYQYLWMLVAMNNSSSSQQSPSLLLAWQVVRHYNHTHIKHAGMGWWHYSGAAMTIWLTQHWSTEQIIAKVAEIKREHAHDIKPYF